jgi:PAS domain S-box-containing protein
LKFQDQIQKILSELGEKDTALGKRLKEIATEADLQVEQSENLLQLSYDEMQKWSLLIEQRESLIKSILDSSTDMILTFDHNGQILEFNYMTERLLNINARNVHKKKIFDLIADQEFQAMIESELQSIGSGIFKRQLTLFKHIENANGQLFPANINFTHISTSRRSYFNLYIRDLSEEIKSKSELDISRNLAAQSSKMASLGEMAGGIAHEINSPLGVIIMNAELQRDILEEEKPDKLLLIKANQIIQTTAERISKIVNGLRRFSRDNSLDPMEEISLSNVVEDSLTLCRQKLKNQSVQLHQSRVPDHWKVFGKSVELTQVMLNLLNNSLDAIEGLEDKWVKIDVSEHADHFKVCVTDSGSGIPQKLRERLMEPFFTTKPSGKGTGIGLPISKGIIESHRGMLYLDETCPHTSFIFTLPKHEG